MEAQITVVWASTKNIPVILNKFLKSNCYCESKWNQHNRAVIARISFERAHESNTTNAQWFLWVRTGNKTIRKSKVTTAVNHNRCKTNIQEYREIQAIMQRDDGNINKFREVQVNRWDKGRCACFDLALDDYWVIAMLFRFNFQFYLTDTS